ncbi:IMP cyclohydrolase [Thermococcus aggregans]|uniref:IMP cyclohydrolase n=1 Tax=Thermococcus aggregans TaxID=110163 RepID=A0A9E7SP36_THEAG|nr:IMP cyclohydrolase [Thermococcus aggregans]USS40961.1 IMP cyclohydrolase [Thermococcus aggregans]
MKGVYVGRMVGVGLNDGKPFAFYRLSSRSFPNRKALIKGDEVYIVNLTETDNPYVSYPVVKLLREYAVVSNGSHTPFIAQALGEESPKKALIHVLDAMGYERDEYNTPRIAAVVQKEGDKAWLGFVGKNELWVKEMKLEEGKAFFTATYNVDGVETLSLDFKDENDLAERALNLSFAHPVLAIGVLDYGEEFRVGVKTIK